MVDDEDGPARPTRVATPSLDRMGIEELHAYVAGLRDEIVRAEAEIGRKRGLRSAAEDVFRR